MSERDVLAGVFEAFEREMWPDGSAHGSGSGIWAKHKARIEEAFAPRLSLTRQPPMAPELWRDAYARIAGQYAVFLERYDLAEDSTAEDIIEAALAAAQPSAEPGLLEALRLALFQALNDVPVAAAATYVRGSGASHAMVEAIVLHPEFVAALTPDRPTPGEATWEPFDEPLATPWRDPPPGTRGSE